MTQSAVLRDPVAAVDVLQSPDRFEAFSALTGEAALFIDLSAAGAVPADRLQRACSALGELPCPTVGVGKPISEPARALAAVVDAIAEGGEEGDALWTSILRAPQASAALVQLLRLGDALDVHGALVAESLVYSTLQAGPEFDNWLAQRGQRRPASENREPAVLVIRDGSKARFVLNRPERRNALSVELRDALVEALLLAVSDSSLTQIAISGAGPAFCSGGDLAEFGTLPDPSTAHAVRSARNAARLLADCADRVRFEVHGACYGAGIELPAFAARVVASADSTFTLPEVSMGLVPGAGGTASLPRRIGRQRTAGWALSGRPVDAELALAWGLIDAIAEPD